MHTTAVAWTHRDVGRRRRSCRSREPVKSVPKAFKIQGEEQVLDPHLADWCSVHPSGFLQGRSNSSEFSNDRTMTSAYYTLIELQFTAPPNGCSTCTLGPKAGSP